MVSSATHGAIALICARGGSKGVPNKNIRPLRGRPLIAWAVDVAREVARIERVIVSTDSETIAAAARAAGAEVPFLRPPELARDDSPEWLVWRHALNTLREDGSLPGALVVVPPTAPLRAAADVERCLDEYESAECDVVITVTDARRSPYFNMVRRLESGGVGLVLPPERRITRRQDVPEVYDMATVAYVVRPSFVLERDGIFDGRVRAIHVPAERALDIDTALDFQIAECLIGASASADSLQRASAESAPIK
jgi:CMP-N-acetylneuraminic acid synthetase